MTCLRIGHTSHRDTIRKDQGLDERRDANRKHYLEFSKQAGETFNKYFAQYGGEQLHLWLLVTHSEFRRRGAAAVLVKWGVDTAEEKGWPVTVFGSPMGQLVYRRLGFEIVGTKVVQVEGEEERLTSAVMQKLPRRMVNTDGVV